MGIPGVLWGAKGLVSVRHHTKFAASRFHEAHQNLALLHRLPGGAVDRGDDAVGWGRQAEHGLHRLQHHQDLPTRDGIPNGDGDLGNLSRNGGNQAVRPVRLVVGARDGVRKAQPPGLPITAQRTDFAATTVIGRPGSRTLKLVMAEALMIRSRTRSPGVNSPVQFSCEPCPLIK